VRPIKIHIRNLLGKNGSFWTQTCLALILRDFKLSTSHVIDNCVAGSQHRVEFKVESKHEKSLEFHWRVQVVIARRV